MNARKRTILFAAYSVSLILGNLHVLRAHVNFARENESASHIVLVPLVTLALIYQNRKTIFSSVRFDWKAGLPVTAVGLVFWWYAAAEYSSPTAHADRLTVSLSALLIVWLGGFVLFCGREAFRAALFPLLFLGFTIPIPQILLDMAVLMLKRGSTESVAVLFTLTGTPYHREGFVFSLPTFVIEIADECSGIRSSIALLITSLLASHMFLRTLWSKTLLVLAVLPVAILKNGIRIVSLSLLATYVNPEFLTGQLHQEGGIVFFLLSLGILAPVVSVLRRSEMRPALSQDLT